MVIHSAFSKRCEVLSSALQTCCDLAPGYPSSPVSFVVLHTRHLTFMSLRLGSCCLSAGHALPHPHAPFIKNCTWPLGSRSNAHASAFPDTGAPSGSILPWPDALP